MRDIVVTIAAVLVGGLLLVATVGKPDQPTPAPSPSPFAPAVRHRLVVCSATNCPPCRRLKAEFQGKAPPFAIEWIEGRTTRYKVTATPTLIKTDAAGVELKRREGYAAYSDVVAWVEAP